MKAVYANTALKVKFLSVIDATSMLPAFLIFFGIFDAGKWLTAFYSIVFFSVLSYFGITVSYLFRLLRRVIIRWINDGVRPSRPHYSSEKVKLENLK